MSSLQGVFRQLSECAYQRGIGYDFSRLANVLAALKFPHHRLPPVVQVAGTNGKGSTIAFLSAILQAAGLRVGTYTSPHMTDYTERIAINDHPISEAQFVMGYRHLSDLGHTALLTEFECLTLMAFLYFVQHRPDVILFETGLGGRLDATNVVWPILSVITRIGLDHQDILGETMADIASEKVGIIKPSVPVVTTTLQPHEAATVIAKAAVSRQAPLYPVLPLAHVPEIGRLTALYQRENAALAVHAARLLRSSLAVNLTEDHIQKGLERAFIWGRFMQGWIGDRQVILDGAHNGDGMAALIETLHRQDSHRKWHFLMGILKTKSAVRMVEPLLSIAKTIYYCEFDPLRCYTYAELKTQITSLQSWSPVEPLPEGDPLIVTGSLYFLSQFYGRFSKSKPSVSK